MGDLEAKCAENVGRNAKAAAKRKNDFMRMWMLKSRLYDVYELARRALDVREELAAVVEVPLEDFADGMARSLQRAILELGEARRATKKLKRERRNE